MKVKLNFKVEIALSTADTYPLKSAKRDSTVVVLGICIVFPEDTVSTLWDNLQSCSPDCSGCRICQSMQFTKAHSLPSHIDKYSYAPPIPRPKMYEEMVTLQVLVTMELVCAPKGLGECNGLLGVPALQ